MKFRIKKQITQSEYYIYLLLEEFTPADSAKATKFGTPKLVVKGSNGVNMNIPITALGNTVPFGFASQNEADVYAENLKREIVALKERWDALEDTWSKDELI
jgi:hypothetical protein